MNKDFISKIRELNQNTIRYLGTVDYFSLEVFEPYTYQFSPGVYRVANRLNGKKREEYLNGFLKKISESGVQPIHELDVCDTGFLLDHRGCMFGWVIRPMDKELICASPHPFDTGHTTVTVLILDEQEMMGMQANKHWLSNTKILAGKGHNPF